MVVAVVVLAIVVVLIDNDIIDIKESINLKINQQRKKKNR